MKLESFKKFSLVKNKYNYQILNAFWYLCPFVQVYREELCWTQLPVLSIKFKVLFFPKLSLCCSTQRLVKMVFKVFQRSLLEIWHSYLFHKTPLKWHIPRQSKTWFAASKYSAQLFSYQLWHQTEPSAQAFWSVRCPERGLSVGHAPGVKQIVGA